MRYNIFMSEAVEGLSEELVEHQKDSEGFQINPKTGRIVSEGYEYANTPRMRELIREANGIRGNLPPLSEDEVRLWRGNRPDEVGKNPSFTRSLEGIALPFMKVYDGDLSVVEVPNAELNKYVRTGAAATNSEYVLPAELAGKARVIYSSKTKAAK